ncbi:MAG: heme o synthase [Actinomycetota bacterium]
MARFRKLSIAATASTFLLVAAGGLVRATGSGVACPHWPGCNKGRFFPPLEIHALIEWSHRTIAGILIALIAVVAFIALRTYRDRKEIWIPAVASGAMVIVQAILGAIVVNKVLSPGWVTAHVATAMVLIAVLLVTSINALPANAEPSKELVPLTAITASATFVLLLVGAYVRGRGAGLAFPDWPLMGGRLLPTQGSLQTPHFVHRLLALVVGLLIAAVAIQVRRRNPGSLVKRLTVALIVLYLLQVFAGALNVWTKLSAFAVVLHVTLAALTWGAAFGLAIVTRRNARAFALQDAPPERQEPAPIKRIVTTYWRLTKPRIILLLLITTVPTMIVAEKGWPPLWLTVATLIGGSLAAGGANAINCYIDRDIDAKMGRTALRPIPSGSVEPNHALEFGIALGMISFGFLWMFVNLLSAALALAALLFYVFVYTIGLKRSTPQNIVIGGAAGAVPVLVGWAAATGTITWAPVVMFAIVFFWTPPHFWALSLRFEKDYAKAGVPMLPVAKGRSETLRQIFWYSIILVGVTLALDPVGRMGAIYLASSLLLGALFIRKAFALKRIGTNAAAWSLFKYSINYLALLFAAMAIDTLLKTSMRGLL